METLAKPAVFSDDSSPVSIWLELHSTGRMWRRTYLPMLDQPGARRKIVHEAVAEQHRLLGNLGDLPRSRWQSLCDGQGWTPIGCAALSWCQPHLSIGELIELARQLEWDPSPEPGGDFASIMINPAILPANDLASLSLAGRDDFGMALLLSARIATPSHKDGLGERSAFGSRVRTMMRLRELEIQ